MNGNTVPIDSMDLGPALVKKAITRARLNSVADEISARKRIDKSIISNFENQPSPREEANAREARRKKSARQRKMATQKFIAKALAFPMAILMIYGAGKSITSTVTEARQDNFEKAIISSLEEDYFGSSRGSGIYTFEKVNAEGEHVFGFNIDEIAQHVASSSDEATLDAGIYLAYNFLGDYANVGAYNGGSTHMNMFMSSLARELEQSGRPVTWNNFDSYLTEKGFGSREEYGKNMQAEVANNADLISQSIGTTNQGRGK